MKEVSYTAAFEPQPEGGYTVTASGKDTAGSPATANYAGSVDTTINASISINSITPDNIHPEVDFGQPVGKEVFW